MGTQRSATGSVPMYLSHARNLRQRVSVCTPRHFLEQKRDAQRMHSYLHSCVESNEVNV